MRGSQMNDRPEVCCVGVLTLDVIAVVDRFPESEGRIEAENVVITGGGPASNAAVALSRQGVSVAVIGRVGDDRAGRQVLSLMEAEGVDVRGVAVDKAISTQTSCIVVDRLAGTRSIITSKVNPLPSISSFARNLISRSQWVHVDHLGYGAVVHECSDMNKSPKVSLDSGNAPIADLDLAQIDLYVPTVSALLTRQGIDSSRRSDSSVTRAAMESLRAGCHAVVATDGADGSFAWWDEVGATYGSMSQEGSTSAASFSDFDMVSTLGAGDVFHGALLANLLQGFEWPKVLRRANAIAGLSCRAVDGREGVPTREELDSILLQ